MRGASLFETPGSRHQKAHNPRGARCCCIPDIPAAARLIFIGDAMQCAGKCSCAKNVKLSPGGRREESLRLGPGQRIVPYAVLAVETSGRPALYCQLNESMHGCRVDHRVIV